MSIANPPIHIICGLCGCNKMFKYSIDKEFNDITEEYENKVIIACDNCGTITYLDELIEEIK